MSGASSPRRVRPPSSTFPKLKLPTSLETKIEEARQHLEKKLGVDLSMKVSPNDVVSLLNQERKTTSPRKGLLATGSLASSMGRGRSRPTSPKPSPRPIPVISPGKISSPRFDHKRFSPSAKRSNVTDLLKLRRTQKRYAKVNFEQSEHVVTSAQLPIENFKQLISLSLLKTGTEDFRRDRTLYYSPVTSGTTAKPHDWSSRELRSRNGMLSYYSPGSIDRFRDEEAMARASRSASPLPDFDEELNDHQPSDVGLLSFLSERTGLGVGEVMRLIQVSEEEALILDAAQTVHRPPCTDSKSLGVASPPRPHQQPSTSPPASAAAPLAALQRKSRHYEQAGDVNLWTAGSPGTVRPGSGTPSDYQVAVRNINEAEAVYLRVVDEEMEAKRANIMAIASSPRPLSPSLKPISPRSPSVPTTTSTVFPEKSLSPPHVTLPVVKEDETLTLSSEPMMGELYQKPSLEMSQVSSFVTIPNEYGKHGRSAVDELLWSLSGPSSANLRAQDSIKSHMSSFSQKKHSNSDEPSLALPVQPMIKLQSTLSGTLKVKSIIEDLRLNQFHLRQSEKLLLPVTSKNKDR